MTRTHDDAAPREIASLARPLRDPSNLDPLAAVAGEARFVLLGEASQGTAEHYGGRARSSRHLIAEHCFSFVVLEGDWPDCLRLNRWVKGRAEHDRSAREVLGTFERCRRGCGGNEEAAAFGEWLRQHKQGHGGDVGFYGLAVYSLWDSLRVVLEHLGEHDPEALDAGPPGLPLLRALRRGSAALCLVHPVGAPVL